MDEKTRLEIEPIDPRLLGMRLEQARKIRGVTQHDAADHLDAVARLTSLSKKESVQRRLRKS